MGYAQTNIMEIKMEDVMISTISNAIPGVAE
jgi:hypothetical protein